MAALAIMAALRLRFTALAVLLVRPMVASSNHERYRVSELWSVKRMYKIGAYVLIRYKKLKI